MVAKWDRVVSLKNTENIMLIGEYTHTTDDKNRISLPSKFRAEIGKKIVATYGLDNCLFLFPLKEWQVIAKKLAERGMLQADTRGFNRFMLGGATEIEVDSIGRILLPDYLREFAGVVGKKSNAVFVGVYDKVEVWSEKRWKEYKKKVVGEADGLAEKLGQVGAV